MRVWCVYVRSYVQVRLYKDRQLIDTISSTDVVMGMRCGRYGREDVSLVGQGESEGAGVKVKGAGGRGEGEGEG